MTTFRSTVTPFQPLDASQPVRLLVDPNTGSPAGVQNQNANGSDGVWTPIDLTSAQIASPSAAILADLNSTFRLNVSPWTRYRSTGAALVSLDPTASGVTSAGISYDARLFGGTWDSTHDVGAAINAAIAQAAADGGGTVLLPAGTFGLSTPIVQADSGVHLAGAGIGIPRYTTTPGSYQAVTKLLWIGAADATMFTLASGTTAELYSVDVTGIIFDAANLAAVAFHATSVSYSWFRLGAAESRSVNIWFDTIGDNTAPGPGNQHNDCWLYSRSTSPSDTYSPTGILIDSGASPDNFFNSSFSRYHSLGAWYAQGDGIVLGNTDNNMIMTATTARNPGNATGRGFVVANSVYTMPNGNAVGGRARSNRIFQLAGAPGNVLGFETGATVTPGVGNAGSGALNTVTLSTNGTTTSGTTTLNFASTTNVLAGMTITSSAGLASGVMTNTTVSSVTSTTVVMRQGAIGTVASATSFTFGLGISASAVPGSYTITFASPNWNITAPSGGHSQTNIAAASGAVTFTDMVFPFTGTPTAADTFVVVVPTGSSDNTIEALDEENGDPIPIVEPGADLWLGRTDSPLLQPYGGLGDIHIQSTNGSHAALTLGGLSNPTGGFGSANLGGLGTTASGFGAGNLAGQNNVASGTYSATVGGDNKANGTYTFVGGSRGDARSGYNVDVWGGGFFAATGDAQARIHILRKSGATASAFRLTGDAATAGSANTINIPNNTAYLVSIDIVALDHTTVANNAVWPTWTGLLTRGANAASTAVTMNATPTPVTNGTTAGMDIAATADTTNGALNVSFTPPTANTDTWNVVARVMTVEVQ